jgi:RHS repeat-associated protein
VLQREELATNTRRFFHRDAVGSTWALTNPLGFVTDMYAYLAYGECIYHRGTTENHARFVGAEGYFDDLNGLQLLGHRYYDPSLKRFISQDPIGLGSGDLNFYAYCGGNPLTATDPEGLDWTYYLNAVVDHFAGWGNTLTGGATGWVTDKIGNTTMMGGGTIVDRHSRQYRAGEITGVVHQLAMIGAEGIGAARAGKTGYKHLGRLRTRAKYHSGHHSGPHTAPHYQVILFRAGVSGRRMVHRFTPFEFWADCTLFGLCYGWYAGAVVRDALGAGEADPNYGRYLALVSYDSAGRSNGGLWVDE